MIDSRRIIDNYFTPNTEEYKAFNNNRATECKNSK